MENERTIPEYLNMLNKSCPDKKHTKKESVKIDISEINKLFDTFTNDIKKLNKHLKELYESSNIQYVKGEINALEYSRSIVANIIEKHLK